MTTNWNDKEVVLAAVKQNGMALIFASEELKNDKEIVLAAVKQDEEAFLYASKEIRSKVKVLSPDNPKEGLRLLIEVESLSQVKQLKKVKKGLKL